MTAIAVEKPGTLRIFDNESRDPSDDEVQIKIERGGICGSDIHILHGSNPFAVYPRIIGHEAVGIVSRTGAGVNDLREGDRVVLDPVEACGECYACKVGQPNVCSHLSVYGVHKDGGFQSSLTLPRKNVVKVSFALPLDIAALAEPFSIAANVLQRTGCGPSDTVLVYGAGTVGLTVLQVAKLHGARCIVSDIDSSRLERALSFGADEVINPRRRSIPEAVAGELGGLGPSVVIDGAGIPALMDEACKIVSPAGRIGILGFSTTPSQIAQRDIVQKELTIYGSRHSRRLIPQVIRWLEDGKLNPRSMITHVFSATEASQAFDLIERDPASTIKVQLDFMA